MRIFISIILFCTLFYGIAQNDFTHQLSDAALSIIDPSIIYDPAYFPISYPGGDVPKDRGVCTDVVIRAKGGS